MDKKLDLYISYCKEDNTSVEGATSGWIDNFQKFYLVILKQLLNRDVVISSTETREEKKKEFGFTTEELLKNTSAFIVVLSSNYLKDQNCMNELELFANHHGKTITLVEDGKKKDSVGIFKAVKNYVPPSDQPELLQNVTSYDLFRYDAETEDFVELVDYFDNDAKRTYWLSLVDLAYGAYQVISDHEGGNKGFEGKTIFLAETTPDQSVYRSIVRRELLSHGFRVLPEKPLPTDSANLKDVIVDNLKQSNIAVHIMGEKYGVNISNSDYSMPEIQNTVAGRFCEENARRDTYVPFERLIWISPDLHVEDEKQKLYLDQLKKDIDNLQDAEIVQTPLEIFKTIVFNKAASANSSLKRKLSQKARSEQKSIYVIHGKEDMKKVKEIESWAVKNGLEVVPSIFEGDNKDLLERHRISLAQCDGVIILYDHYNEQWLNTKLQDLKKSPGFGRKGPFRAKAIYMGLEDSEVKQKAIDNGLRVIENEGEFQSHYLNDFLNDLLAK